MNESSPQFKIEPRLSMSSPTKVHEDPHLKTLTPRPIADYVAIVKRYTEGRERVSAYRAETGDYHPTVELLRPKHGATQGGKGLSLNTNNRIFHTMGMSGTTNVVLAHGCPSSCSFCFPEEDKVNKIKNSKGFKLLSDVKPGEDVSAPGESVHVISRKSTGIREVREYETREGRKLRLTPDHPVLVYEDGRFQVVPVEAAFSEDMQIVQML